jgi:hypothetical protein
VVAEEEVKAEEAKAPRMPETMSMFGDGEGTQSN